MTYSLSRVEIEGFRGYGERAQFDCSGDVVVLVGSNGWGKTSFFDAITWCLFGRIRRLLGTRDSVGDEFIRNRFYPDVPPFVSLGLRNGSESVVVARDEDGIRVVTGTGELSQAEADQWVAELVRGRRLPDEADQESLQDDPESVFLRCHQLSQDQMAAFLRESSPRDRFDVFASLLGLDVVRSFYRHLSSVKRQMDSQVDEARRRQLQIEQRLESVLADIEEIESDDDGSSTRLETIEEDYRLLIDAAADFVSPAAADETEISSARDLAERVHDLAVQLDTAADSEKRQAQELNKLNAELQSAIESANLARQLRDSRAGLQVEAESLRQRTDEANTVLQTQLAHVDELRRRIAQEDERRSQLAAFLTLADQHLTGDQCPLCQQAISLESVRASVAERLQSLPSELVALEEARNAAEGQIQELRTGFESLDRRLGDAESQRANADEQFALHSARAQDFRARVIAAGLDPADPRLSDGLEAGGVAGTERSNRAHGLAVRAQAVARRASFLAGRNRLQRLQEQAASMQAQLGQAIENVKATAAAGRLADQVVTGARRAERDLVDEMFRAIQPTVDVLYGRLRPHPVLDRLRLEVGSYDERGELRFKAYTSNAEANVSTIFSSAQLNAVAVCVFLAMNLSLRRSGASFALLDDPIQNMDDFNILGLLDLLRGLLGERQFVLSTHDEQIGQLIRRKLRPLRMGEQTILHRFVAYEGSGPVLETDVDAFSEAPSVLEAASGG